MGQPARLWMSWVEFTRKLTSAKHIHSANHLRILWPPKQPHKLIRLKLIQHLNSTHTKNEICKQFPYLFKGLGTLGEPYKIQLRENSQAHTQEGPLSSVQVGGGGAQVYGSLGGHKEGEWPPPPGVLVSPGPSCFSQVVSCSVWFLPYMRTSSIWQTTPSRPLQQHTFIQGFAYVHTYAHSPHYHQSLKSQPHTQPGEVRVPEEVYRAPGGPPWLGLDQLFFFFFFSYLLFYSCILIF